MRSSLTTKILTVLTPLYLACIVGCSDPYTQVVARPDAGDYSSFEKAMKKLPTDEKQLVNDYLARKTREGVNPVGITIREAIDDERKYEKEQKEVIDKVAKGLGIAIDLAGRFVDNASRTLPANPSGRPSANVAPFATPSEPPKSLPPPNPSAAVDPLPPPQGPQPSVPAPSCPPQSSQPSAPAPSCPPHGQPHSALSGAQFSTQFASVESYVFPHERLARIKALAGEHYFLTAQALALTQTLPFADMQIEALTALYPHIVDREHFEAVYSIFVFGTDRERLRNRIRALQLGMAED